MTDGPKDESKVIRLRGSNAPTGTLEGQLAETIIRMRNLLTQIKGEYNRAVRIVDLLELHLENIQEGKEGIDDESS